MMHKSDIVILLIIAIANTSLWGVSEVYIHDGLLINGLTKGFTVSFLCVLFGCILGKLIIKGLKV